jgi:hypothetical protein
MHLNIFTECIKQTANILRSPLLCWESAWGMASVACFADNANPLSDDKFANACEEVVSF